MKRFSKLHFIALFLLTTACRVSENSTEPSQVVNIEDKYEVKLPNSLTNQNNLYEQASLQYGDRKTDFFVAVIDENREEVNDLLYEALKDSLRIRSKKAFCQKSSNSKITLRFAKRLGRSQYDAPYCQANY